MMHSVTSDKAHPAMPLIHLIATITVSGYERAKAFANSFKSQYAPKPMNPNFANITTKVEEEVECKEFPNPLIAPFPGHDLHNIISDEIQGYLRVKIWS